MTPRLYRVKRKTHPPPAIEIAMSAAVHTIRPRMNADWTLHYRTAPDGGMEFAETMTRNGRRFLRKGKTFTHGEEEALDHDVDIEAAGFAQARTWLYNPSSPDYTALKSELEAAVSRVIERHSGNAMAIITDSSFMTVDFAVHSFPDLEAADDEALWVVDEWGPWISDDSLDPAYRWLLAYGFNCDDSALPHEIFHANVLRIFQEVLTALPKEWRVRLIYVGGDDCGHRWSVPCMEKELASRMMSWI